MAKFLASRLIFALDDDKFCILNPSPFFFFLQKVNVNKREKKNYSSEHKRNAKFEIK